MRGVRGRDVGMVFQNPLAALNPSRTVSAQIEEAYRVHHGGRSRARPGPGPSSFWARSVSRTRQAGSMIIRTSFPVACASA